VRYKCCDERRVQAVKDAGALNGIEYLEVSDSEAPSDDLRQRTLFVRLFEAPVGLDGPNVVLEGGERISVAIEWAAPATQLPAGEDPKLTSGLDDPSTVLLVRTDARGDFSTYTLRLVVGPGSDEPPANFDPLLAAIEFSFKVECPSDFDCAPVCDCPPEVVDGPAIDYLAKDYRTFRSLMLDRLSLLAPEWKERSTPDVGIALVELLAYVADELSYRQDAVATEAYLKTARRRTSLRRHAKLVDYVVQEGSNARVWVRVFVDGEGVVLASGTPLLTRVPGIDPVVDPDGEAYLDALAAGAETFETVDREVLYATHEQFSFWTWGDLGCCLPRGATSATLVGDHPHLKAGDVLVLAEVADPRTGRTEDGDPAKRTAVRLTHVFPSTDPSGGLFTDDPNDVDVPVTEIEWDEADALPFPFCISVEDRPELVVGEAWGNVVLADHGRTISEALGTVPAPVLSRVAEECDRCEPTNPEPIPIRFRPTLARRPVTHARLAPTHEVAEGPLEPADLATELSALTFGPELQKWLQNLGVDFSAGPAIVRGGNDVWSVSDGATVALLRATAGTLELFARPKAAGPALSADPRTARPAVTLNGTLLGASEPWSPQVDLLNSDGDAAEFVVEVEHDGAATLRFGDGVHGRRPDTDTSFEATYRVGNGVAGNVGKGAIAHIVKAGGGVTGVVNPLQAAGGVDPEAAEAIRRDAPEAYLIQERAVTQEDYASVSERNPHIQRAAATFRWTGSWHTVFVTPDAVGGHAVDEELEIELRRHLEPFRMAGYDLEVDAPRFVPLDVELHLCVEPEYFRAHVREAVLDVLSSRVRPDGSLGFFHPDRFTFGKSVYLSAIVAAAQGVPGVQSVDPQTFQRQHDDASSALDTGVLAMNRLEIGRLDNDPTFPDRGVLVVTAGGGK
jgi:hypothetical protein